MIKTKQIGSLTEISATNGLIHKIGTDTYFKKGVMLPSDTLEMYEEVESLPPYTKDEYDAKVAELVRTRYSESEEFAIQRKMLYLQTQPATLNDDKADTIVKEFDEYNAFVEECKVRAKEELER